MPKPKDSNTNTNIVHAIELRDQLFPEDSGSCVSRISGNQEHAMMVGSVHSSYVELSDRASLLHSVSSSCQDLQNELPVLNAVGQSNRLAAVAASAARSASQDRVREEIDIRIQSDVEELFSDGEYAQAAMDNNFQPKF